MTGTPASNVQSIERQWIMLRSIPRYPQSVSATTVRTALLDAGYTTTRRTVERDLIELARRFALQVDDSTRPYRWSWMKNANFEFMPRLTASQCVALKLAQVHIRHLLPQSMLKDLAPVFEAADRELAHTGWKDFHKRTAIVPATLRLLPPKIDAKVISDVQHALARRVCLDIRYRSKGSPAPKQMRVHPLGLLLRGAIPNLVCTIKDYGKVIHLVLHRMSATTLSDDRCAEPEGFHFNTHAETQMAIESRGTIRVHLRFHEAIAADHLLETPLSEDQTWTQVEEKGPVDVEATVENDEQLRWWALGFGGKLEVIGPESLRNDIGDELRKAAGRYGV
jgi:predicted DNA-binding transcriptional regulator YafY